MNAKDKIRKMVSGVLLTKGDSDSFSDQDPLVTSGRIDSLEVMQITVHLEEEFGVDLSRRPFDKYDFESVETIAQMVEELRKTQL